jgi:hypothetical protein
MFHQKNSPTSQHAQGKAIDFALSKPPTKEEGAEIVGQLKKMGASLAIDEYNNPSAKATAGHIHAQVSAAEGGIANGPKTGYPATLHGEEAIVPLNGTKEVPVKMDLSEMTDKLDQLIRIMKDQHGTSEKILYAQS